MKRTAGHGAVVLGTVAVATAMTEASFAVGAELSFEWYLAAVALVAWWCGRRAALLASIVCSVVLDFLALPYHQFSFGMGMTDVIRLVAFLGIAALIAHLVSERDRAVDDRAQRERLLTMVAHELGNMLFALRTWTTALNEQTRAGEQAVAAVGALERTTDAITRLAGDLMDWARLAAGELDVHPRNLDLAAVARDAINEMSAEAERVHVTLASSLTPTWVRADYDRLHQVALNLIANSLRATAEGDEILISVSRRDHWGNLTVREGGRGSAREAGPRLLRQRRAWSNGSSGIGLSLSRDFIRAQGGRMMIRGGLGGGATVCVELPMSAGPEPRGAGGNDVAAAAQRRASQMAARVPTNVAAMPSINPGGR